MDVNGTRWNIIYFAINNSAVNVWGNAGANQGHIISKHIANFMNCINMWFTREVINVWLYDADEDEVYL